MPSTKRSLLNKGLRRSLNLDPGPIVTADETDSTTNRVTEKKIEITGDSTKDSREDDKITKKTISKQNIAKTKKRKPTLPTGQVVESLDQKSETKRPQITTPAQKKTRRKVSTRSKKTDTKHS